MDCLMPTSSARASLALMGGRPEDAPPDTDARRRAGPDEVPSAGRARLRLSAYSRPDMRPAGVLIFEGGEWVPSPSPGGPHARFAEIRFYYANLIGYARVVLCLAAGATITTAHPLLTAALLLVAIAL